MDTTYCAPPLPPKPVWKMRVWAVVLLSLAVFAAKDPAECEVCRKVVDDVRSKLSEADRKDLVKIETTLGKFCDKPRNEKESKLVRVCGGR